MRSFGSLCALLDWWRDKRYAENAGVNRGDVMKITTALKLCTPPVILDAVREFKRHLARQRAAPSPESMAAVIHGATLRLPPSHHLPGIIAAHPSYDTALPELSKFLYARKLQQLIVIDVGANVGDTAGPIAAAIGADNVKFICIEGDPQYLPFLRQNVSSLDADIIVAIAGPSNGEINASLMGDHGTSSVVQGTGLTKMISIESVTDRTIDILKIDTDGFELEVLKGAGALLRQPNIIVFTEYAPQYIRKYGHTDPTNIFFLMSKAGFNRVLAYDNIGIPIGVFSTTGNMLTSLSEYAERKPNYYFDLLFDRDGDRLKAFYEREYVRLPKLPPWS